MGGCMKIFTFALAAAAVAFGGAAAQAADTLTYNSTPNQGWFFGTGNDYSPANTAVLDTGDGQIYLRAHQTYQIAPASDGAGVYSFALGIEPISFDWGVDNNLLPPTIRSSVLITLTNIGTGASFSYDPFPRNNDNETNGFTTQNSFRLIWAPIGFDSGIDNTYRITLDQTSAAGDPHSLSIYAKLGAGAAAVPEPATWAMMISGFGLVGGAMRRRATKVAVTYA